MKAFVACLHVELRLFGRDPAAGVAVVALPLILLLLNGGDDDIDVAALTAGLFGFALATVAIAGLAQGLADYRATGVFRRLSLTEITATTVLGVQGAVCLVVASCSSAVLAAVSASAFGLPAPTAPLNLLVGLLLGGSALFALALLIAGIAPSARSASGIAMGIYFPMLFVSGAAYPRERLPELAEHLGRLLPLTWTVESFSAAWGDTPVAWEPAAVLAAWVVVGGLGAIRCLRWTA